MIPIEAGTYHEEQIDELFASLLGRTFTAVDEEQDDAIVGRSVKGGDAGGGKTREEVEVGSLRIFG